MELVQEEITSLEEKLVSLQNRYNHLKVLETKLQSVTVLSSNDTISTSLSLASSSSSSLLLQNAKRGGRKKLYFDWNNNSTNNKSIDSVSVSSVSVSSSSRLDSTENDEEINDNNDDSDSIDISSTPVVVQTTTSSAGSSLYDDDKKCDTTNKTNSMEQKSREIILMLQYHYFTIRQAIDLFPYLQYDTQFWLLYLQDQLERIDLYKRQYNNNNDNNNSLSSFNNCTNNYDTINLLEFADILFERTSDIVLYDKDVMILACMYDMRIYERLVNRDMTIISSNNRTTTTISLSSSSSSPTAVLSSSASSSSSSSVASTSTTNSSSPARTSSMSTTGYKKKICLSHDVDIVTASIHCSPLNVLHVDSTVQKLYPQLIATAIQLLPIGIIDELQKQVRCHLDYSLWTNRDVVMAWIIAGGPFLENHFHESFRDDPQIVLAHLHNQHHHTHNHHLTTTTTTTTTNLATNNNNGTTSTNNGTGINLSLPSSQRLRGDKEFMIQAIKMNGRLLQYATIELQQDFDIIVTAFSDYNTMVYYGMYTTLHWNVVVGSTTTGTNRHIHGTANRNRTSSSKSNSSNNNLFQSNNTNANYEYMVYLASAIQDQVSAYDNWITILCAISSHKNQSKDSSVTTSNNNHYTSTMTDGTTNRSTQTTTTLTTPIMLLNNKNDTIKKKKTSMTTTTTSSSSSIRDDTGCYLQLLNLGIETNVNAYSKAIAEYVGIPTGERLRLLRQTRDNLSTLWGL